MYDLGRVIVLDRNDVRREFQSLNDSAIQLRHTLIPAKVEETASVILFRGNRLRILKDRTYGFVLTL